MSSTALSSETLHASSIALNGQAVLLSGRSGSGKSDLALRMIDRGATLISDDYTILRRVQGKLLASAPLNLKGKLEVRGLGILAFESVADLPVTLFVNLDRPVERMPEAPESVYIAGVAVPSVALSGLEASAPVKLEVALSLLGMPPE
ncbi:MAG TPA: HPr kinase/phosphatase C-terminal domain-containing protein [Allosphingosinicella sp.]|nr:HPr kinase/phosphatase C-terminal domain-containing protein [Allosphingosinicella sp.]